MRKSGATDGTFTGTPLSRVLLLVALATGVLRSQETPTPLQPKIQLSGTVEADAVWNLNDPADRQNQSLGFVNHADQLRLTEATLSLDADFGRTGFHFDGGFGDFYKAAMASDSWRGPNQYVSQAFLFWKPVGKIRIEAGKFFSSVGAEVPQSAQDYNTTRSLLFWYASPLYHVGVRASAPIGRGFTTGVQLLSGCNTVTGAHGHQTPALTAAWSGKHWGWSEVYMDGNEKLEGSGRRHLSDTVLTFTPSRVVTGYMEAIGAVEKRTGSGYDRWYGWATAWKVSPREKWSFSPRVDWLNDPDAATTGTAQRLFEFTMTGEYRPRQFVLARLEYRSDWSNEAFFRRAASLAPSRNQQVVLVGLTFLFHREL